MSTVKLLGLNISSDLRWNGHVAEISKKVASRLYFLKQLKRANFPAKDLLIFYLTCIRPVTEYACPVFHNVLPAYLSAELEQLQKRAMRIIFPFVPYSDTLPQANMETLSQHRQSITTKPFASITCNSNHKLHELLPPRNNCESNLRRKRNFNVPLAKTKRLKSGCQRKPGKMLKMSAEGGQQNKFILISYRLGGVMDKYNKHGFFTALVLEIRASLYSTLSDAIFISKFLPFSETHRTLKI